MDLTDKNLVWAAWRSLSQSQEWGQVVEPYLMAARSDIHSKLPDATPEDALRLLGKLSAIQEMIDLPAAMLAEADQQERFALQRHEQEMEYAKRRRDRPFARWRAGFARR